MIPGAISPDAWWKPYATLGAQDHILHRQKVFGQTYLQLAGNYYGDGSSIVSTPEDSLDQLNTDGLLLDPPIQPITGPWINAFLDDETPRFGAGVPISRLMPKPENTLASYQARGVALCLWQGIAINYAIAYYRLRYFGHFGRPKR